MRRSRSLAFVLAYAALSFAATKVRAQIEVDVPEDCGSRAQLEAELARLSAGATAAAGELRVTIDPKDESGLYSLRVSYSGEARSLRDANCRTLFRSAVVIVAASLRAEAPASAEPMPETAKPVPTTATSPLATRAPRASAREDDEAAASPRPQELAHAAGERARWHASLAAGGGVTFGLGPKAAPRVELIASVEHGLLGGLLGVHFVSETASSTSDGHGARVMALGGKLAALVIPVRFLRFAGGAELDLLPGRGVGSATTENDSAWGVAVIADAAIVPIQAGRLRLELVFGGQLAVVRPRFNIVGYGDVYRVPLLGGSGSLRVAFAFF